MGIEANALRLLLEARASGINFGSVATVGRQNLDVNFLSLKAQLKRVQIDFSDDVVHRAINEGNGYTEPLLRLLGASETWSVDNSPYEGASRIHDMNEPIPDSFKKSIMTLIDGGSLEHIFNIPTAIRNYMEMLKVGGRIFAILPSNNFMGHGFYQFSPEFFFRVFSPANGFRLERLILSELLPNADWYDISDPEKIGQRVELLNCRTTVTLLQAVKEADVPLFAKIPAQTYWVKQWTEEGHKVDVGSRNAWVRKVHGLIRKSAPDFVQGIIGSAYQTLKANTKLRFNPAFFKKIK